MDLSGLISEHISQATNKLFTVNHRQPVGGGCINKAFRLDGNGDSYFLKINRIDCLPMLTAEATCLATIAATKTIRVPEPVCYGEAAGQSYLVLEYIEFGRQQSAARFGEKLAAMHQCMNSRFGFDIDNTIGFTPQINKYHNNWTDFWQQQRLGYQLALAQKNGCGSHLVDRGQRLIEYIPEFFRCYTPSASLLHGDLWGGNYAYADDGEPVIFDPATYYGDREADIAMTELFGGFRAEFYSAYNNIWPLDEDYKVRKALYNLYHIINHFNLFGGGYLSQAEGMVERLLTVVG